MQTIDLRQAIVMRVQDNSAQELSEVIQDSVGADERALPGLGVLFEMIWQQSSEPEQSRMVDSLYKHLHESTPGNPT
ncbi:small acid-soluble spore protein SspI [Paenibacillus sp. N4]|uniref:small acid-soluble spore protein SspI n=1 Tax=Paenibacillus vietnamensis TaxID=2590547 RepID=UPI001CD0B8F9|nr:small acid-soluble spore protein SspI [Paenibacillus vietnamensis]MCA0757819.1 small acid-soluble spore protein SspI [Paenibacillus vietnamensis]